MGSLEEMVRIDARRVVALVGHDRRGGPLPRKNCERDARRPVTLAAMPQHPIAGRVPGPSPFPAAALWDYSNSLRDELLIRRRGRAGGSPPIHPKRIPDIPPRVFVQHRQSRILGGKRRATDRQASRVTVPADLSRMLSPEGAMPARRRRLDGRCQRLIKQQNGRVQIGGVGQRRHAEPLRDEGIKGVACW